jgi:apolipoprotein N-acyltransferase
MTLLARLAATALSALAFAMAFPPASVKPLAWLALAPFLLALRGARLGTALALGELWTLLAAWGVGSWMPDAVAQYFLQPRWLGWLFFFTVATGMAGVFTMGFAAVYRALAGRLDPRWMAWAAAAAWTAAEVGRGRLLTAVTFLSNPWGLIGYSQVGVDVAVQAASLFGVYGIGFAIAAVNAAAAEAAALAWRGGLARARLATLAAAGLAPAALLLAFGALALRGAPAPDERPPDAAPVAVVQGHVDLGTRWRSDFYGRNVDVYLAGTREALARAPGALVVWPEAALTFFLDAEPLYRQAIARAAAEGGGEVALGGPRRVPGTPEDPAGHGDGRAGLERYFNSFFVLDGSGRLSAPYDKQALVPFTEYPPLARFDLVRRRFDGVRFFSFGAPTPPLATRAGPAGVLLCNEGMLPELAARRVAEGAAFLVNPSNDTWIPSARFADHLFDIVRLRAVEQRRWLVRASTSGPSAIVDPWGRVQARSAPFERAVVTGWIAPRAGRSLYGRIGDASGFACVAALPIAWAAARRARTGSPRAAPRGSRAATR